MPKDKPWLIGVTGHFVEGESTQMLWDRGTRNCCLFTDLRLWISLGGLVRLSPPKNIPPIISDPLCLLRHCAKHVLFTGLLRKNQEITAASQLSVRKMLNSVKLLRPANLRSAPKEPKLKWLLHCHSYPFKAKFSRQICWYLLMLKHQDINQQEDSERKFNVNEPERLQRRSSEWQTFLYLVIPTVQTAVVTATAILLAPQYPLPTAS